MHKGKGNNKNLQDGVSSKEDKANNIIHSLQTSWILRNRKSNYFVHMHVGRHIKLPFFFGFFDVDANYRMLPDYFFVLVIPYVECFP